jgi:hypothetical protein
MTGLDPDPEANDQQPPRFHCGHSDCGALLKQCRNYWAHAVCNRCIEVGDDPEAAAELCGYCRYTETIPNLTIPENPWRWYQLETAKRRLLYMLDELELPYGRAEDGVEPPLSFDFVGDDPERAGDAAADPAQEPVFTGHMHGRITVNLREADPVEREKARVQFGEAHRTLIGHLRHEIGHYFWDLLIAGRKEEEFKSVFGDYLRPPYAEASERYYREGAVPNWQETYISAYASMHPWEDFAETFAAYLDMAAGLDTARHWPISGAPDPKTATVDAMIAYYQRLGILLNEFNRNMGLMDLVPEVLVPPVREKLAWVHQLVRDSAGKTLPPLRPVLGEPITSASSAAEIS